MPESWFEVDGYRLCADRYYDAERHLWVELRPGTPLARVGFDPLGRETSGDIVEVSLSEVGVHVNRGSPFGNVEAAKFVGPLQAPVSGFVRGRNMQVLGRPGVLNEDPNESWLVELEMTESSELALLLTGEEDLRKWFVAEIERFKRQGSVAE
ncbi:MAG: glycine cleavage system protein H [Candidatus Dormibacterales bacterium]